MEKPFIILMCSKGDNNARDARSDLTNLVSVKFGFFFMITGSAPDIQYCDLIK